MYPILFYLFYAKKKKSAREKSINRTYVLENTNRMCYNVSMENLIVFSIEAGITAEAIGCRSISDKFLQNIFI